MSSFTRQLHSISITHKPRNKIKHIDELAYLLTALPIDEERTKDIGKHKPSIDLPITQYQDMYINVVFQDLSEEIVLRLRQTTSHQVPTRKRKSDQQVNQDEEMINERDVGQHKVMQC